MLTGTSKLIKLILRRDRVKLPVWIFCVTLSLLCMIPLLQSVYGDQNSLNTLYQTFSTNPAGVFLTGPIDEPTFGALFTIETLLWWGLGIAFMNTLLIVRHTRQNEEIGAQELILSGQVHRGTSLVAALVVAFGLNLITTIGIGIGMTLLANSWSTSQAWLYALSLGLFGFAWAAIAGVIAQFVENTRGTNGILAGLIGIMFILRGIGDFTGETDAQGLLQPNWPSYLSPFGWLEATRSLTFPQWWPLIIPAVFSVVAVGVAFVLLSRRDVGAGILPARKGKPRASALLKTPLGITWHLQKNIFIGWLVATMVMVVTIGALVPEMTSIYETSQSMMDLITSMGGTGAIIPAFLSAMLSITVLMVAAYAIQGLSKLRSEEVSGHLENLLATKLSRLKWLSLHSLVVLIGSILMLALTGFVLALTVVLVSDYSINLWQYTLAALSYAPMILAFIGGYILLFGFLPRTVSLVLWIYFGFVVFMTWIGPLLKLGQRVMDLSIMTHISAAPAESITTGPLILMTGIAVVCTLLGSFAWRQRNLTA